MPFDWKDVVQQQLANTGGGGGMQTLNAVPTGNVFGANQQMNARQQYPNAKFPRARQGWENIKTGLFGSPEAIENVSTVTPQQQGIMQLLQQLGIYGLQNPYEGFEGIENQARNQFAQQTVPSLAERFTSMGNNALSSGAFVSQLGGAGAGLEADLNAQKAQYGQQNIGQILQMLQLALQPQFENIHRPQSNGFVQNALLGGIQAAPGIYQGRQISKAIEALTKKTQE
jgi:hypothetical protein